MHNSSLAVKRQVAKLVTFSTFDGGTVFSGVPNLVAVAADTLLIIMYNSAPLASYLERIRN